MTSPKMLAKHEQERQRLGLPKSNSLRAGFEDSWNDEEQRTKFIAQQESAWEDLRQAASRFEKHVLKNWVENGEEEPYEIPKLETLQRSSPTSLGLPEYLERVQLGAGGEGTMNATEEEEVAIRKSRVGFRRTRHLQAWLAKSQVGEPKMSDTRSVSSTSG